MANSHIFVGRPAAMEEAVVRIQKGQRIILQFTIDDVVHREDANGNIILHFADGGRLVLVDGLLASQDDELSIQLLAGQDADLALLSGLRPLDYEYPANELLAEPDTAVKEEATGNAAQSQGGGGEGDHGFVIGSGIGIYRNAAGDLLSGWNRLGRLDIEPDAGQTGNYRNMGANPRQYSNSTSSPPRQEPTPVDKILHNLVMLHNAAASESDRYLLFNVDVDLRNASQAVLALTLSAGNARAGLDYDNTVIEYRTDGSGAWLQLPLGADGKFNLPLGAGLSQIAVRLTLGDDNHLTQADKTVQLKLDGLYINGVADNALDGSSVTVGQGVILDDNLKGNYNGISESGEKDGPIISLSFKDDINTTVNIVGRELEFVLNLFDPHNPDNPYAGYADNNGLLAQDITLVLQLGGSAQEGLNYYLDIAGSPLQTLLNAGKLTISGPDASGRVTITLNGMRDANGNLYSNADSRAFNLTTDADDLSLKVVMQNDPAGERREITLEVLSVTGNESQAGSGEKAIILAGDYFRLEAKGSTVNESDPGGAVFKLYAHLLVDTTEGIMVAFDPAGSGSTMYANMDFNSQVVEYSSDGGSTWVTLSIESLVDADGNNPLLGFVIPVNYAGGSTLNGEIPQHYLIRVPLIDDQITESDEILAFTVVGVVREDSGVLHYYHSYDSDSVKNAVTTVMDDDLPYSSASGPGPRIQDGPQVNVLIDAASPADKEQLENSKFTFKLEFFDIVNNCNYDGCLDYSDPANPVMDTCLQQDVTIKLQLGGEALLQLNGDSSANYAIAFTPEFNQLIAEGKVFNLNGPDTNGIISFTLKGCCDASGVHDPAITNAFDLSCDLDNLTIEAQLIAQNSGYKSLTIDVIEVKGLEAGCGSGDTGYILSNEVFILSGGGAPVSESAAAGDLSGYAYFTINVSIIKEAKGVLLNYYDTAAAPANDVCNYDSTYIEYSLDNGQTWIVINWADYGSGNTGMLIPSSVLTVPDGSKEPYTILLRGTLIDNHLSETPDAKNVGLEISAMRLSSTDEFVTNWDTASTTSAASIIADDTLAAGNLDGAMVNVTVDQAALQELNGYDSANSLDAASKFVFSLDFIDPHSGQAYAGDPMLGAAQNQLVQDATITLTLGGTALEGVNYTFAISDDLQALINAGKVGLSGASYNALDGTLTIPAGSSFSLNLNGLYDSNGVLKDPAPTAVFDVVNDVGGLTFEARLLDSGALNTAKDITLTVSNTSGAELQAGLAGNATILADDLLLLSAGPASSESATGSDPAAYLIYTLDATMPGQAKAVLLAFDESVSGSALSSHDYVNSYIEYWDAPTSAWVQVSFANGGYAIPAGVFTANTLTQVQIRVTLIDDHISESASENLKLKITGLKLDDGRVLDDADNYQAGSALDATGTINDDTLSTSLDGPVVSVKHSITATQALGENQVNEGSGLNSAGTDSNTKITYTLDFKDPVTNLAYAGFNANGFLQQDMSISFNIGGTAERGTDYVFQLKSSPQLQNLIASGTLTISGPNASGDVTITLRGQYDANGLAHSSGTPFNLSDLSLIVFEALIIQDNTAERTSESIVIDNITVIGNESRAGGGSTVNIVDHPSDLYGPILLLSNNTVGNQISESLNSVTNPDGPFAPSNNLVTHTINLVKPDGSTPMAAPEDIRVLVSLTGINGAVLSNGSNAADFAWNGNFTYTLDGVNPITLAPENISYNSATGQYTLTIPKDALALSFEVEIIDDARETNNEAGHGYQVKLELVYEDSNGNFLGDAGYDSASGLPDGGARLSVDNSAASATDTISIIEDSRSGAGELNPALIDGPFVVISAEASTSNESGGNLPFVISLKDPSTGQHLYNALENVMVTIRVSGDAGFNLSDLLKPGGGDVQVSYTVFANDGTPLGSYTVTIPAANALSTTSCDLNFTIPQGGSYVKFSLPVNDDPLGGISNTTGSAVENSQETVTLTIVQVKGNEARAVESITTADGVTDIGKTSASITIVDDAANAVYDGIKLGLSWQSGVSAGLVSEGGTAVALINLFNNAGNPLTAANNPYAAYMNNGHLLPEDLQISMSLGDTTQGGDLALKLSANLLSLVQAGKVVISMGGTTYDNTTATADLNALELLGDFTLTLKGGQFNLVSDALSLTFNAHVFGDKSNEYDASADYQDEHPAAQETFTLSITGVQGNESQPAVTSSLEATISDVASGKLTLSGGEFVAGQAHWAFSIALSYDQSEYANHPTTSMANGGVDTTAGIITLPTEAANMRLKFTDGFTMQHDQEYLLSPYRLFLSMNGLTEGDAGVPDEDAYNLLLAGNNSAYFDSAGWIMVGYHSAAWSNVTLTSAQGIEFTSQSRVFDIYVPVKYWDSHTNGQIDFVIDQGRHLAMQNIEGGFSVELLTPAAGDAWDFGGEILDVDNLAMAATAGDVGGRIVLSLSSDQRIYENPSQDGSQSNISTYKINFTYYDSNGNVVNEPFRAAGEISFDFTLRLDSGSAQFNSDTSASDLLYKVMKDFALCDADGNILEYSDIADAQTFLQNVLDTQYPPAGSVSVAISMDGENVKFTFTVQEGLELDEGIEIYFVALDDNITENPETIQCQVGNPSSANNMVEVHIATGGTNSSTTTIYDESENLSGYALALGRGVGYEITANYINVMDKDGIPLDGQVYMPVYAYILGNGLLNANDGAVMSLTDIIAIYQRANPDVSGSAAEISASAAFQTFVTTYFAPSQTITVNFTLTDDSGVVNVDYQAKSSQSIAPNNGSVTNWILVIEGDHIYFQSQITIASINDYIDAMGDTIDFYVTIDSTSGNESRPVNSQDQADLASGHDKSAVANIKDYHDGPVILSMGPEDKTVLEPVDGAHSGNAVGDRVYKYTMQLNEPVTEPMVVWMDIAGNYDSGTGNGAKLGEDFCLGEGIYLYNGNNIFTDYNGNIYTYHSDGTCTIEDDQGNAVGTLNLPANFSLDIGQDLTGKYFFIIDQGSANYSFDVRIMHDNKNEVGEEIEFSVISMQGSEAVYMFRAEDNEEYAVPWAADVPFVYAYMDAGVRHQVTVDLANQCYTEVVDGQAVTTYYGNTPPNWLPYPDLSSTLNIVDEGLGPWASIASHGWVRILDDQDTSYPGYPQVSFKLQCACDEDVEIDYTVRVGGVTYTLTTTIKEGDLTSDTLNIYAELYKQSPPVSASNQTVEITMVQVRQGEAQNAGSYVLIEPYSDHSTIVLSNLRNYYVDEGLVLEAGPEGYASTSAGTPEYSGHYALNITVPQYKSGTDPYDIPDQGIDFTITINTSSDLNNGTNGMTTLVTVHLSADKLADIQGVGAKTITIGPDGVKIDGSAAGVITKIVSSDGTVLNGSESSPLDPSHIVMPTAKGDAEIEGTEYLGLRIVDQSSGVYVSDHYSELVINDQTYCRVVLFIEDPESGLWVPILSTLDGILNEDLRSVLENAGELKVEARLVRTDASGNFIDENGAIIDLVAGRDNPAVLNSLQYVNTRYSLDFDINYTNYSASSSDYNGDSLVSIAAGSNTGSFNIRITQDESSEDLEDFLINLSLNSNTIAQLQNASNGNSAEYLSHIITDSNGAYGNSQLVIADDGSGPQIRWYANATTLYEHQSLVIDYDSWQGVSRQVVSEDVRMEFLITAPGVLDDSTGNAHIFTLDDIEAIIINGSSYTISDLQSAGMLSGSLTTGWTLVVEKAIVKGKGIGQIEIKFKNDVISEYAEQFTIELQSVYGGETTIADSGAGYVYEPVKTITVEDYLNGPAVDLVAGTGSETTGTVTYQLQFSGGSPTQEASVITLKLNEAAMKLLLGDGSAISIRYGAVTITDFTYVDGLLSINLPDGVKTGEKVDITFPVKDNSLLSGNVFGLSIDGVEGGELSLAGGFVYTYMDNGSGPAVNGQHGGTNSFVVSTTSGDVGNFSGTMKIVVGGVARSNADYDIIKELVLDGLVLVKGQDWDWDSNHNIVISAYSPNLQQNYNLVVYYTFAAQTNNAEALAYARNYITINEASVGGREVVVPVENEIDEAIKDGPVFSITLDDTLLDEDSAKAGMQVSEGEPISGKISIDMCGTLGNAMLPGDMEADGTHIIAGDISLLVSISANADGSYNDITIGGTTYTAAELAASNGKITLLIPEGSVVPALNGVLDIDFSTVLPVSCLSGDGRPPFTITISDPVNAYYEKLTLGADNVEVDILPGSAEVPLLSLSGAERATEEGAYTVNLALDFPGDSVPAILLNDVTVVLHISADANGSYHLPVNPGTFKNFSYSEVTDGGGAKVLALTLTIVAGATLTGNKIALAFDLAINDNSLMANTDFTVSIASIDMGVNYKAGVPQTGADELLVALDNEAAGNLDGPAASIAIAGSVVEGEEISGSINLQLPLLGGDVEADNGYKTFEALSITLALTPGAQFALDQDLLNAGYACAYDAATGIAIIVIPAGETTGTNGLLELDFTITAPDNSLAGDPGNMQIAITGLSGAGAYETYKPDTSPQLIVMSDDVGLNREGPTLSLQLNEASVDESATFSGSVTLILPGLPGDPQDLGGEFITAEALTITVELSANAGGLVFSDYTATHLGNGVYSITIPAGTQVPAGGLELVFSGQALDNSLAVNSDISLGIIGLSGSGAYEEYPDYASSPVSDSLSVNNDSLSGPTASLSFNDSATGVDESAAFSGSVTLILPGLPGDPQDAGGEFITAEALTITVELSANADSLVFTDYTTTHLGSGVYSITIPAGTQVPAGGLELVFSGQALDNSLAVNSAISLSIVGLSGSGAYEKYPDYASSPVSDSLSVNNSMPLDGFTLGITSTPAADGTTISYSLVLSALGSYYNDGDQLQTTLSFSLDTTGFTEAQLLKIEDDLNNTYSTVLIAERSGDSIDIVLNPAYAYDAADFISFDVQADTSQPHEHSYQISLSGLDASPALESLGLDASFSSTNDQLALTINADAAGQTIYGGAGDDTLYGNIGDDILVGGAGDDNIYSGSAGTNIISGGAGSDNLYSQGGNNTFYWGSLDADAGSHDIIYGFDINNDSLDIGNLLVELGLDDTGYRVENNLVGNATISFDGHSQDITLVGINAADLTANPALIIDTPAITPFMAASIFSGIVGQELDELNMDSLLDSLLGNPSDGADGTQVTTSPAGNHLSQDMDFDPVEQHQHSLQQYNDIVITSNG